MRLAKAVNGRRLLEVDAWSNEALEHPNPTGHQLSRCQTRAARTVFLGGHIVPLPAATSTSLFRASLRDGFANLDATSTRVDAVEHHLVAEGFAQPGGRDRWW